MTFARSELAEQLTCILGDLIAIPSPFPPGDTSKIVAYAEQRLRKAGYETQILHRVDGMDNLVAKLGLGQPSLVFNAHCDTVGVGERSEWDTDPFQAVIRDGQVFGLGAGNCKGSMAVQLWLAERVAHLGGPQRGEIVFAFVSDEESLGPNGTEFLRDINCIHPDILILGGQTDNQLVIAERGVLWVRLTAKGRAAHAGDPEAGDNAIMRMVRLIAGLYAVLGPLLERRRDGPLRSTINVGQLHGGHNTNVVPSICTAEIDRRLLPGEKIENALAELREVLVHLGEPRDTYEVELLTGTNGFSMPYQGKAIAAFRAETTAVTGSPARFLTATGVSDGRYFADDGIEIVSFGPGSGAQGHAANESVPIDQMVSAATIQVGVVARLLGLSGPDALTFASDQG